MKVNIYRLIDNYGDGILIIIPNKTPDDIYHPSLHEWSYLGKHNLSKRLLKLLGWNGKDEYIKVFYIE